MDELLYYDLKNVSGLTPGLATQVCREIGRRIVAGLFPEGQFIDDETKLCERFNVEMKKPQVLPYNLKYELYFPKNELDKLKAATQDILDKEFKYYGYK